MKEFLKIGCLSFAIVCLIATSIDGQECVDCNVRSINWVSAPVVKAFTITEMQKQSQWKEIEVEVPVTRKFEEVTYTREVFDGGLKEMRSQRRPRRLRAFNWACVATGVAAFVNCSTAKRGERVGLLRRILNRRQER
tara:strand:+ start:32 stop:442 length:411 start_codon:yes stop_codon:yes gene_type:complete